MERIEFTSDDPMKLDDLIRFFEEKTPKSDCPSCRTGDWNILLDDDSKNASEGSIPLNGDLKLYHAAILLCCRNCGHINMYHRYVFDRWMKESSSPEKNPALGERGFEN
ncbi:hypothetical protein [Pseudomonas sp.]|uniref:hypothetical protein n=1 Tax=Pseudomonas sp. TaxID=306 RepID=UPI003263360E